MFTNSVEKIMKSFNKAVTQLNALEEKMHKEQVRISNQIQELDNKRAEAIKEGVKAAKVAAKLTDIIN